MIFLKHLKYFLWHAESAELYEAQSDAKFESDRFLRIRRILREKITHFVYDLVIVHNSVYPIHQIIYIKVDQKSNFFTRKFQI